MLANSYYLVHTITNRPIVRLHLRSFKETSKLWQLYFAHDQEGRDFVDGMPLKEHADSTALGLFTEASVASEVAQHMQYDYAVSPAGL